MPPVPATTPTKNPTRVVIVDDSRVMRDIICSALDQYDDINVVGSACDPFEARDVISETNPDVITLDVEMPNMGGLEFLRHIMAHRPTPVIMVSGRTRIGADTTLKALQLGAFDFVTKPTSQAEWDTFEPRVRAKVIAAGQSGNATGPRSLVPSVQSGTHRHSRRCELIAVGASTGGVTAITTLIAQLPDSAPPVVIVQHMPGAFISRFTDRLASASHKNIALSQDGEVLSSGMIRLAPGQGHLEVARQGIRLQTNIVDAPPVNNHRPSIDTLFNSVAVSVGEFAFGIILTGMGSDGAEGLLKMQKRGAQCFGESRDSCVVYGMPKAANRLGAVNIEMGIDELALMLRNEFSHRSHIGL